jgi:hypothetical protein
VNPPRRSLPPLFVVTLALATALVFLQAVIAGVFVNQDGRDSWVTVHGVVADATWVAALVAAVVGLLRVRRTRPTLAWGTAALFVLTLAQTGIGHLITDKGMDGLIVVHVPLAVLIFGLATWLMVDLGRVSRGGGIAAEPYAAEPRATQRANPLPVANDR